MGDFVKYILLLFMFIVAISSASAKPAITFYEGLGCQGKSITFTEPDGPDGYYTVPENWSFSFGIVITEEKTNRQQSVINTIINGNYNITLRFFEGEGGTFQFLNQVYPLTFTLMWQITFVPTPPVYGNSTCMESLPDGVGLFTAGSVSNNISLRSYNTKLIK